MENYGFVYIWLDRKHKRYYIGSHWGTENDGYVCSSTWMNRAYKRRPNSFKRKIIRKFVDRKQMLQEERRIINMIKPSEIGTKYYNLRLGASDGWHTFDDEKKLTVAQRISAVKKANFDKKRKETGQAFSHEHIKKLSHAKLGSTLPEDHKAKISESGKKAYENGRVGYWKNKQMSPEHRAKLSAAGHGKIIKQESKEKLSVSNSKKYRIIRDGSEHIVHGLKSYGKSEGIPYVSLFKAAQTGGSVQKYGISSISVIL
jgi:hypothetical protein